MSAKRTSIPAALGATITILVLAVAAYAATRSPEEPISGNAQFTQAAGPGDAAKADKEAPRARESLAILRRSPDAAGQAKDDEGAKDLGANVALARKALTTASGEDLFVVPSRGGVCLATTKGTFTCGSDEAAAAGRVAGAIICGPGLPEDQISMFGLMPDGVERVTVRRADGSGLDIPVRGNAYAAELNKFEPLPVAVEWESAEGPQSAQSNVPPDGGRGGCRGTEADMARYKRAQNPRATR